MRTQLPKPKRSVVAASALLAVAVAAVPFIMAPAPTAAQAGPKLPGSRPVLNGREAPAYQPLTGQEVAARATVQAKLGPGPLVPPSETKTPAEVARLEAMKRGEGGATNDDLARAAAKRDDAGVSMLDVTRGKRVDVAGKSVQLPPDAALEGPMSVQRTGYRLEDGTIVPMIDGKPAPDAEWPETDFVRVRRGNAVAFVGQRSKRIVSVNPAGAEGQFAWLAAELAK